MFFLLHTVSLYGGPATSKTLPVIFRAVNHCPSDQAIVLTHSFVYFLRGAKIRCNLQFKLLMLPYLHIGIWKLRYQFIRWQSESDQPDEKPIPYRDTLR